MITFDSVSQQDVIEAADLDKIIAIHKAAFAGYTNTLVGERYLHAFFRFFMSDNKAIALKATLDGEIVGYVVGARVGYGKAMRQETLWPAVTGILTRPWLIFKKRFREALSRQISSILHANQQTNPDEPDLQAPIYSLVGIGVDPTIRGKRVGQQLTRAFEQEARRLAAKSVRLSVYGDNRSARRMYERQGWETLNDDVQDSRLIYYFKRL